MSKKLAHLLHGGHLKQIGVIQGNAIVLNVCALLVFGGAYALFYKILWDVQRPDVVTPWTVLEVVVGGVGLIVAHELIHAGMARAMIGPGKVGIRLRFMVIECHVGSRLTRNQYVGYAAAPTLVLALLGLVLYYAFSSVEGKFFASLLFLGGAAAGGGDLWFIARVMRYGRYCSILDRGLQVDIFENDASDVH